MANIKSAKKRILVTETKAARNKAIKSKVKTAVKKVETAVAEKNVEAAKAALHTAIVEISKAGSKGVYHKKTVSRKIARLSKAVDSIALLYIENRIFRRICFLHGRCDFCYTFRARQF